MTSIATSKGASIASRASVETVKSVEVMRAGKKDAVIDLQEFCKAVESLGMQLTQKQIERVFSMVDARASGGITLRDLESAMRKTGVWCLVTVVGWRLAGRLDAGDMM